MNATYLILVGGTPPSRAYFTLVATPPNRPRA